MQHFGAARKWKPATVATAALDYCGRFGPCAKSRAEHSFGARIRLLSNGPSRRSGRIRSGEPVAASARSVGAGGYSKTEPWQFVVWWEPNTQISGYNCFLFSLLCSSFDASFLATFVNWLHMIRTIQQYPCYSFQAQ